jgi:hypothetical protein
MLPFDDSSFLSGTRKKRKRADPLGKHKAHSAYTLFVHENYGLIKRDHGELPSREIISILARQWGSTSEEEKQIWKYRAEQAREEPFPTVPGMLPDDHETDDDETLDEEDGIDDDTGGGKRRANRRDLHATSSVSV